MKRMWFSAIALVYALVATDAQGQTFFGAQLLEDNAVYALLADTSDSPPALGVEPPCPRLCKLRFTSGRLRRHDVVEFETIHEFGPCQNLKIRQFDGLACVALTGIFGSEGFRRFGLRSFSYDDLESTRARDIPEPAPDETLLLEKGGRAYAALYWIPRDGGNARLLLVDLETMKEQEISAEQWEYAKPAGPLVPGAPWPLGRPIEDISVSVPSKEQVELVGKFCPPYIEDPENFSLAYNDTGSLLLFAAGPVDDSESIQKAGRTLHFDKHAETWTLFTQSGNRPAFTKSGPWLISPTRYTYPESDRFGPASRPFCGLFNVQTRKCGGVHTESDRFTRSMRVLHVTDRAALAVGNRVLYLVPFNPVTGRLDALYNAYQCTHEEMPYVQALFLRPRPQEDGESKE